MKDWRTYDPRKVEDDKELVFDHSIIHSWWNNPKLRPEGITEEDLKRLHDEIVEEMKRRGIEHHTPLELEKPYAVVHSFREESLGEEIELSDVLKWYEKPIVIAKDFVCLVGGLSERGKTDGDIDLLIKWPENVPDEVVHPVRFRLGRALPKELARRVQFLLDKYHGPFTSYVPLYDLVLMPTERQLIQMETDWIPSPVTIHDEGIRQLADLIDETEVYDVTAGSLNLARILAEQGKIVCASDIAKWSEILARALIAGEDLERAAEVCRLLSGEDRDWVQWLREHKLNNVTWIGRRDLREVLRSIPEGSAVVLDPPRRIKPYRILDQIERAIGSEPLELTHEQIEQLAQDIAEISRHRNLKLYLIWDENSAIDWPEFFEDGIVDVHEIDSGYKKPNLVYVIDFAKKFSTAEIKGVLDEVTRAMFLDHMDIQNVQVLVVPFAGTGLFIYDALKRNPNLVVYANDFASWSRVCMKSLLMGIEEDIEHVKEKYGLQGYPNYAAILALAKWINEGKQGELKQYAEQFAQKYTPLNAKNVHIFQKDAREFAKQVEGDIAFVDPPKMTRRGVTLWKKFDELDTIIEGRLVSHEHDIDLDKLTADVIKNLNVKKVYVNTIRGGKPSISGFSHREIIRVGRDTLSLIQKEEETHPKVILATICGKTKDVIDYGYPYELWGEKEEVREIHNTGLPYAIISYRYGFAWWDTKYPYYDEWNSEDVQPLIENAKKAMRPGVEAIIVYLKSFPHGRRIVHELQKALPDVEFYVVTSLQQALEFYEKLKDVDLRQQKLFDRSAQEEAKQSKEENCIEPLRFFYPLKATKGYHEGEVYNLEQILAWFKYPEDYPLVLQKKYDGLRIIWAKKGDTVYAWTDDGTRCEDRFPTMVKMLKELPVEELVLDSETEGWSGKEHWGREITAGYARAHDQPADDANFVVNVFDVLYVDGLPKHHELDVHGDLHEQPYEVRLRILDYIGALAGWQSTDEVPKTPGFNVVKSYWLEKPDVEKLEKLLEHIKNLPGSEGAMIKSAKSDYPLTGHTNLWLKYKKSADVHAVVIERLPTKTEGVYRYRVGLLMSPNWKAPEDEVVEITLKNGKKVKVLDVGKTFNTDKKLEQGDIVTVMFHTLFVYDDGRVKLYEPKLYEVRSDQVIPDTVVDAIKIAEQAGLVQKKQVSLSDMNDTDLMQLHSEAHWKALFELTDEVKELHDHVAAELERRGYIHLTPLEGYDGHVQELVDISTDLDDTGSFAKFEIRQWAVNYLVRQNKPIEYLVEAFGGLGIVSKWYRDVLKVEPKKHIIMEMDPKRVQILREQLKDAEVLDGNNVELLASLKLPRVDLLDIDPYNDARQQLESFLANYNGQTPVTVVGTDGRLMIFMRNGKMNLKRHMLIEDAPDSEVELRQYLPDYPRLLSQYLSTLATRYGWTFKLLAFSVSRSKRVCYWLGTLQRTNVALTNILYLIPHCKSQSSVLTYQSVYPWELYADTWNTRIYSKLRSRNLPFAVLSEAYGVWFWDERKPPVDEGEPSTQRMLSALEKTAERIKERGYDTVVLAVAVDPTHEFVQGVERILDKHGIKLIVKSPVELSRAVRYGMQFHFRGGSVHADLRIEKPDGSALQGWTLAIQEEDLFEKEVMKHWKVEKDGQLRKVYWDGELYYVYDMKKDEVLEWNSKLDDKILQWHKDAVWKHPEWWKIDLKTGRPRERQPGEGVDSKRPVVEKIWATKKQDEPCMTPDSVVWTIDGLKFAKDVKVGDKLLSTKGIATVTKVGKFESSRPLYRLKPHFGFPVTVNEGHKFLVLRGTKCRKRGYGKCLYKYSTRKECMTCKYHQMDPPIEFVAVEQLTTYDYLVMPKIQPTGEITEIVLNEYDRSGRAHKRIIPADYKLGFIVGYTLGDGTIKSYRNLTEWWHPPDGCEEMYEYEYVKHIFPNNKLVLSRSKTSQAIVQRLWHRGFVEWFNQTFPGKTVSMEFLRKCNKDFLRGFVDGLIAADGMRKDQSFYQHNANIFSAFIYACLLTGRLTSIRYQRLKPYEHGRLNSEEVWHFEARVQKTVPKIYESDEYWFIPIREIECLHHSGVVIGIETDTHDFSIPFYISRNTEWLDVEGVYPPREIEPVPGGTRFWPGVFVRVDSGTVEYGAQKSYFKEYFFDGKVLKGRYVLRLVNRNGELIWLFWKTDDETPYVISKRAVETGWMPPLGESALPEKWEKKVPKELRWWEAQDVKEARRRRDEFVRQLKLESDRFLLQYQWWKGPVVIRRGPSEDRYYLRVIRKDGVIEIEMNGDPRREHVPGIVRDVEYDEFWDIGEGTVIDIPPGSEYNPTKATPSWLMTLESGKAKILQEDPLVLKIDLGENRTFIAVRSSPDEDVWECWIDYASPEVKR